MRCSAVLHGYADHETDPRSLDSFADHETDHETDPALVPWTVLIINVAAQLLPLRMEHLLLNVPSSFADSLRFCAMHRRRLKCVLASSERSKGWRAVTEEMWVAQERCMLHLCVARCCHQPHTAAAFARVYKSHSSWWCLSV